MHSAIEPRQATLTNAPVAPPGEAAERDVGSLAGCFGWLAVASGIAATAIFLWGIVAPGRASADCLQWTCAVFAVIVATTLAAAALGSLVALRHRWGLALTRHLFGSRSVIPSLIVGGLLAAAGLSAVMLMAIPHAEKSGAGLAALGGLTVWPAILALQFGACWSRRFARWSLPKPSARMETVILLTVLFFSSFVPRLMMSSHAVPYQNVWDEVVTYSRAIGLMTRPGLDPQSNVPGYGSASYGHLLVYGTVVGEVAGLFQGLRSQQVGSVGLYTCPPSGVATIHEAVHASGLPLSAPRRLLALINSVAPLLIFVALRRYFGADRWAAFGGGLFYALFSRDVIYYTSFILPDALATTFVLGLLVAAWQHMQDPRGRLRSLALCAIFAGLTVSVTIRLALVALLPVVAVALAADRSRLRLKALTIVGGLGVAFCVTSPYALLDLPGFLSETTSLVWRHDSSFTHRLSTLAFFLRGMFWPDFRSDYVGQAGGSPGFGLLVGALALLGLGRAIHRYRRPTLLIGALALLILYTVTPIIERYTRHALVLYPAICLFAAVGLSVVADALQTALCRFRRPCAEGHVHPVSLAVLAATLLASAGQIAASAEYVQRMHSFQPSQVQAAAWLERVWRADDKVAILDTVPWVEADLDNRNIRYIRVPASATLEQLRARGITWVAGTDRSTGTYGTLAGTIWTRCFDGPGQRVREFGSDALRYQGYPCGNIYLFVARLPTRSDHESTGN